MDVGAWLRGLGLSQYEQALRDNDVDADLLVRLTAEDLKRIGVASIGHQRRLLDAIATLKPEASSSEPSRGEVERRQLTVVFVDLVGSTALSARLDPEEMLELLRAYQRAVTAEIERLGGRVSRFLGDGVLAYFGFPHAREDDAERAVHAGLAAVAATAGLRAAGGQPLAARVGIATGLVVAGDMAGEDVPEAVVGETPNLAARLQALAEPGMVVIAGRTRQLVGGLFEVADLGAQALKGFAEPVPAWQVKGIGHAVGRFEALRGADFGPLVGREREMALLLGRWTRAKEGDGQVVLLGGEPGIGKSRLVRALRDGLGAEPHTSLRYQCSPQHTDSALWLVIEQLERAAGIVRNDLPEVNLDRLEALLIQSGGDVGTSASLIADLLGLPAMGRYPPLDLTPQRRKALTFEALLARLAGLAARSPVLVVLEDAHWIDPTSQELFEQVVARIRRLPVLLVATHRLEFQSSWTSEQHAASLMLSRFGKEQAQALAEQVAGGRSLPAGVMDQILAKADGVPLFLEELTKTVLETGLLEEWDGCYRLKGLLPEVAIPSTLNDSLMARLDRLAAAKKVAQVAAAIGREFSHELLVAVADRPVDELNAALRELIDAELIFCHSSRPETVYAFKHALVRDAAYESLLKSTRRRLHGCIARALEQNFQQVVTAQPDLIAYHYAQAKLIREAVPYYLQAGRIAVMRSATTEATSQLTAGLALLEAYPDGPERAGMELGLQIALGDALRAAKGSAATETGAAFARARKLAMLLNAKTELIRATHGQFNFYFGRAELHSAREAASSLVQYADEMDDLEARSIALEAAGLVAFSSGDLLSARSLLENVLSIRLGNPDAKLATDAGDAASMIYLALTLLVLGYPQQAYHRYQQALRKGEDSKQPFTLALALADTCYFHHLRRDWAALESSSKRLIELATEKVMPGWLETGLAFRGLMLAHHGQLAEGMRLIKFSLEEASRTNFIIEQPYFFSHLAEAYVMSGHLEEGLRTIDGALERVCSTGERWFEAELHRLKGEFSFRKPTPDMVMAEGCFGRALGIAKDQHARWWQLRAATSLAELWAEHGERRRANDLLVPVYGQFTEGFDTPDLRDAKALLDTLW